jgi:hypothetical protein
LTGCVLVPDRTLSHPTLKPVSGGKYKMLFGITVGMTTSADDDE